MESFILGTSGRGCALIQQSLIRNGHNCPADHIIPLGEAVRLKKVRADLVLIVLPPDPDRALAAIIEARSLIKSHIMAVGPGTDTKLILRILRSGADEFLVESDLESELEEALTRLNSERGSGTPAGLTAVVLAASGGSGASTIAVNLAAVLARERGGSVLIDLKLETGDLASLLDLQPMHTLADLCVELGQVDRNMFEQSLASHASGIRLLASPRRQASIFRAPVSGIGSEGVTAEAVRQVLTLARASKPNVVVEVSPTFREEQIQALRMADTVLLINRLDFTALRNARRILEHLEQVGIERERVRLVGNRHGQPQSLSTAQAEEALGIKFFHLVPDDPKTMNRATNIGSPAVVNTPGAHSSKSLRQLALSISS